MPKQIDDFLSSTTLDLEHLYLYILGASRNHSYLNLVKCLERNSLITVALKPGGRYS